MSATKETELEKALYDDLSKTMAALWNVQGVLNLIHKEGTMGRDDFPQSIASAIRMMSAHVDSTIEAIDL